MKVTNVVCDYCSCDCERCSYSEHNYNINPTCPYKSCQSSDYNYSVEYWQPESMIIECIWCSKEYKVLIAYNYIW